MVVPEKVYTKTNVGLAIPEGSPNTDFIVIQGYKVPWDEGDILVTIYFYAELANAQAGNPPTNRRIINIPYTAAATKNYVSTQLLLYSDAEVDFSGATVEWTRP